MISTIPRLVVSCCPITRQWWYWRYRSCSNDEFDNNKVRHCQFEQSHCKIISPNPMTILSSERLEFWKRRGRQWRMLFVANRSQESSLTTEGWLWLVEKCAVCCFGVVAMAKEGGLLRPVEAREGRGEGGQARGVSTRSDITAFSFFQSPAIVIIIPVTVQNLRIGKKLSLLVNIAINYNDNII